MARLTQKPKSFSYPRWWAYKLAYVIAPYNVALDKWQATQYAIARHVDWHAAAEPCPPEICPICQPKLVTAGTCELPPKGWFCTLPKGHGGSCPTWPEHHRSVS